MKIVPGLASTPLRPLSAVPAPGPGAAGPSLADRVSLSSPSRRNYRALAWTGFGVQCLGAGLTLTGHGGVGVAVFAAGSAMLFYGEMKARQG